MLDIRERSNYDSVLIAGLVSLEGFMDKMVALLTSCWAFQQNTSATTSPPPFHRRSQRGQQPVSKHRFQRGSRISVSQGNTYRTRIVIFNIINVWVLRSVDPTSVPMGLIS